MNLIRLHHAERNLRVGMWSGLSKRDQYVLLEDTSVELPDGNYLLLPKGYVTDIVSSPSPLWSFFPPYDNKSAPAFAVHDRFYECWEKTGFRSENPRYYADLTMLQLCLQYDPDRPVRHLLYFLACRLFGARNWNRFRQQYALQHPVFDDN